jgi:hypothetical protein
MMNRREFLKNSAVAATVVAGDSSSTQKLDPPLNRRLRGTESRPLVTDVEAYVADAVRMDCNVMTIGPMNGQHFTAFPTRNGTPYPKMQPDFIPRQVRALHQHDIAAIGWLPFNVQDLKSPDQCQAAAKHPEWRMEYVEVPGASSANKVGMCVISSPWRQMHAGILKEAASQGIDGVFFDGFYLAGIPHPPSPGCVCRYCREKFKAETGLNAPKRVDWADPAFKKWVRWRSEKLLEVARYFIKTMREANPALAVTCNYNTWPFPSKDWETAVPLWASSEWGISQHGYSGVAEMEWLMAGYKARLSHDLNPSHSDIWRSAKPTWNYRNSPEDRARYEMTMRTFMLAGLATGVTPWHGGSASEGEILSRVHRAIHARESFFSTEELRHIGVVVSQNTDDFYGHAPGAGNLTSYRDAVVGAWLLLAENHAAFRFVFDNQLNPGELSGYKVLLLPGTVCLSDAAVAALKRYAASGGKVVATGNSGDCDEWGSRRPRNALEGIKEIVRLEGDLLLAWVRTRDRDAAASLLKAIGSVPPPHTVDAAPSLFVNACWEPGRKSLWFHLLNVSAFYPDGDTGFRGAGAVRRPAQPTRSDAQIAAGGRVPRVGRPERGAITFGGGLRVRRARLGVSGADLRIQNGRISLPDIEVHDVLVVDL